MSAPLGVGSVAAPDPKSARRGWPVFRGMAAAVVVGAVVIGLLAVFSLPGHEQESGDSVAAAPSDPAVVTSSAGGGGGSAAGLEKLALLGVWDLVSVDLHDGSAPIDVAAARGSLTFAEDRVSLRLGDSNLAEAVGYSIADAGDVISPNGFREFTVAGASGRASVDATSALLAAVHATGRWPASIEDDYLTLDFDSSYPVPAGSGAALRHITLLFAYSGASNPVN